MLRALHSALIACVLAAGASAAGPSFREVAATTNAAAHLELSNAAVELRVFPQEGGRVEGCVLSDCRRQDGGSPSQCTNLCSIISVDTNFPVAWRALRATSGERTIWLGYSPTNGVSRSLGLTLGGGSSPLNMELILANNSSRVADVAYPVRARLQPFELLRFRAVATNDAPVVLEADPGYTPMSASLGRARATTMALACKAITNNEFRAAMDYIDRAIDYGGASSSLYVCKAYCLRKLGVSSHRLRAQSSKILRHAERIEPLDTWGRVERAFLDDDGEGAAMAAICYGGDLEAAMLKVLESYRMLGAKFELDELERQMRRELGNGERGKVKSEK